MSAVGLKARAIKRPLFQIIGVCFLVCCLHIPASILFTSYLHAQMDNAIDPSGTWTNGRGTISLMLTGDALSFSWTSVFGNAHICDGAGVAGLEKQNEYHFVDESGRIAFVITKDSLRLHCIEGSPSFCGAEWPGETYTRAHFIKPIRCPVSAKRARFHVVMPMPPLERKGYVSKGDVVELVEAVHEGALPFLLARYKGKNATTVGLLRKKDLLCGQ